MHLIIPFLDIIARGGGGGSGGGSGGGGGGGIVVLGYLPAHFASYYIVKKWYSPFAILWSMAIAGVYGTILLLVCKSIDVIGIGVLLFISAIVGGIVGYFSSYYWIKRIKKTEVAISESAKVDPAWDKPRLLQMVNQIFMTYQNDWSKQNIENMKTYLTPRYWQHNYLMLAALKLRDRVNRVEDPEIIDCHPYDMQDSIGQDGDRVAFYIQAGTHDVLFDNFAQKELFVDDKQFTEYWHFVRSGNTWLLDSISQAADPASGLYDAALNISKHPTQVESMIDSAIISSNNNSKSEAGVIAQLAASNNMFYSPDWGWLLLPKRGQLFGAAKFGTSRINNHVIGLYHNLLVELYSYLPNPASSENRYVIAQVALPKRYDSFIVKAKKSEHFLQSEIHLFGGAPKGYNKLELEWPDFNKRYVVYATNVEQVTAFELLHPVFMEKLFALDFKVSIEVVDEVVYLYSSDKKANYEMMFVILKDAFEEMKL